MPGKPAAAPADPERAAGGAAEPLPNAVPVRPAGARGLAQACAGAHIPRRTVPGRADGRPLRAEPCLPRRQSSGVDLAAERRARRLALTQRHHPLGRVPEALRRQRGPQPSTLGARAQRRPQSVPRRCRRGAGAAVAARRLHQRGRRQGRVRALSACPVAHGQRGRSRGTGIDRRHLELGYRAWPPRAVRAVRYTDLQVTLSEVRPDGAETYVQNGWLRASYRELYAARSTALDPVPTNLKRDAAPLPRRRYALVRVPIYAVGHAFRAGSRIRVTLEAAGGDRPRWDFGTIDHGRTLNTIALGGARASRLVLPVLAGATAKGTPLPGPTALRGQPSRPYAPASNGG